MLSSHYLSNHYIYLQVVSPIRGLPVEMRLVPFEHKAASLGSLGSLGTSVHLRCLPASGFHHVKRVAHSGQGLR